MDEKLRRLIYRKTRSRAFLWKLGLAIVLLGLVLGFLLDFLQVGKSHSLQTRLEVETAIFDMSSGQFREPDSDEIVDQLITASADPEVEFPDFLKWMPLLKVGLPEEKFSEVTKAIELRFGIEQADLLRDFFLVVAKGSDAALERIAKKADQDPPERWANQILGEVAELKRDFGQAYLRFKTEGLHPDAEYARQKTIRILLLREDYEELARLKEEPVFSDVFTPSVSLQSAIHSRDWWQIIRLIPATQMAGKHLGIYLIAGLVALVWAILLLQLGQIEKENFKVLGLCLAGFLLGVLSITPTLFLVILQDDILSFQRSGDWIQVFAYYIGGVGFREEFCKLLLFIPLAPILAKRRNELETLIVASFVGLGFAAEENLNYFMDTSGLSATSRFLTANFFHITLTGIAGLYLCRVWRQGFRGFNEFLYAFGIVVILHGCYNAFLSISEIQEGGFIAMALFILLSKFYFAEIHSQHRSSQSTFSVTSVFVIGLSLLIASMIAYQSSLVGPSLALQLIVPELLGSAIILFMFFREFSESIGS